MTIAVQHNRVIHTGNGATTLWPADFSAMDDGDVEVWLYTIATGELELLSGATYNLIGVPGDTFSVQYPMVGDAIASTHKLIIQRIVDLLQPSQFSNSVGFDPATLTLRLDDIVRQIQQVNDGMQRALKVDISETDDPDEILNNFLDAVAQAQASASAAQAAQEAAEAAQAAAEAAQEAAEQAASTINLPAVADTMLVRNSANNQWLARTAAQVKAFLATTAADVSYRAAPKVVTVYDAISQGMVRASDYVVGDGVADDAAAFQACVTAAAGRDIFIGGLTIRVAAGEIILPSQGLSLRGRGKIRYEGTGNLFKGAQIDVSTYNHVATAGQTVFTSADPYLGCYVEVELNGVYADPRAYTLSHDTTNITVTFPIGRPLGENVAIKVYRINPTVGHLGELSQVLIGSGVEITTTQTNVGRAIAVGWYDGGFASGRQGSNFTMENGSMIRGETGVDGFRNAIWLHAAYNVQIDGFIFGRGANEVPGGGELNNTQCDIGVLVSGEFTSSDFKFTGGDIGFYNRAIASFWSTAEGFMCCNETFLNVGYAIYALGRTNNNGQYMTLAGCHVNAYSGVIYAKQWIDIYAGLGDYFQNPLSTKPFFAFFEFEGAICSVIEGNNMRSFVNGANCTGVRINAGYGIRSYGNHFFPSDAASVFIGMVCDNSAVECVTGPNDYYSGARALLAQPTSSRIGAVTKGDVWHLTQPTAAKYTMLGTHWWIDDKWLVLTNTVAQSIPNNAFTAYTETESRDPEQIYTGTPITVPAWASRMQIKITAQFVANVTGIRAVRVLRNAAGLGGISVPANASGPTYLTFEGEFGGLASGDTIPIQFFQNSGGALDLAIGALVQVRFF